MTDLTYFCDICDEAFDRPGYTHDHETPGGEVVSACTHHTAEEIAAAGATLDREAAEISARREERTMLNLNETHENWPLQEDK